MVSGSRGVSTVWVYLIIAVFIIILSISIYSRLSYTGAKNINSAFECGAGFLASLITNGELSGASSSCSSSKSCDDLPGLPGGYHYQYIGSMGCSGDKPYCCAAVKDVDNLIRGSRAYSYSKMLSASANEFFILNEDGELLSLSSEITLGPDEIFTLFVKLPVQTHFEASLTINGYRMLFRDDAKSYDSELKAYVLVDKKSIRELLDEQLMNKESSQLFNFLKEHDGFVAKFKGIIMSSNSDPLVQEGAITVKSFRLMCNQISSDDSCRGRGINEQLVHNSWKAVCEPVNNNLCSLKITSARDGYCDPWSSHKLCKDRPAGKLITPDQEDYDIVLSYFCEYINSYYNSYSCVPRLKRDDCEDSSSVFCRGLCQGAGDCGGMRINTYRWSPVSSELLICVGDDPHDLSTNQECHSVKIKCDRSEIARITGSEYYREISLAPISS